MKKQKLVKSDFVAFAKSLIPKTREVVDIYLENSHLVMVLDNELHVKIKNK